MRNEQLLQKINKADLGFHGAFNMNFDEINRQEKYSNKIVSDDK